METRFQTEKTPQGKRPSPRLYAPSRKQNKRRRAKGEAAVVPEEGRGKRVHTEREIKFGSRVAIIVCSFIFAGMVLFTLTGYERITRAYADVNTINVEIDETKLTIAGLDVAIECAVTIQDAQAAAESLGMQYPDKNQYLPSGSTIPPSALIPDAPADNPDTGDGGADTTPGQPEGTDAPPSATPAG